MGRILIISLFSFALFANAEAQSLPDFSGTWVMDEAQSGSPDGESFAGPVTWRIQQLGNALTQHVTRGERSFVREYVVGERSAVRPAAAGQPNRAYWDGTQLVTETLHVINGQSVTVREVRSLSADGREMFVERVVEVEHGYTMRGAQNFSVVRDVFRRVP